MSSDERSMLSPTREKKDEVASPTLSPTPEKPVHLSVRQIMEGKGMALAVGEHHDGSFHTYFAHKITKLQNSNQIDEDEVLSDIFKGCYVFINGSTEPPIEGTLKMIM